MILAILLLIYVCHVCEFVATIVVWYVLKICWCPVHGSFHCSTCIAHEYKEINIIDANTASL